MEMSNTETGNHNNADKADAFARDLTELSRKHGIGIGGISVLFIMEPDDADRAYTVDADSRIAFTAI